MATLTFDYNQLSTCHSIFVATNRLSKATIKRLVENVGYVRASASDNVMWCHEVMPCCNEDAVLRSTQSAIVMLWKRSLFTTVWFACMHLVWQNCGGLVALLRNEFEN